MPDADALHAHKIISTSIAELKQLIAVLETTPAADAEALQAEARRAAARLERLAELLRGPAPSFMGLGVDR
jgi:hypothetical protein